MLFLPFYHLSIIHISFEKSLIMFSYKNIFVNNSFFETFRVVYLLFLKIVFCFKNTKNIFSSVFLKKKRRTQMNIKFKEREQLSNNTKIMYIRF